MVHQGSSAHAIFHRSTYGPTFGLCHDIHIASNANQNTYSHTDFGCSYSRPNGVTDRFTILAGSKKFSPDEVEVFYLAWVPLSFLFPCSQKPSELKEKLLPQKSLLIKTNCKAKSIGSQNFHYFMCLIHGFILLFKLNGTHVLVRWSGTRSESVSASNVLVFSRCPGHQKQIYFNLAITDLPGLFTRFGAKMVPNTGLRRDADRSAICVYICFIFVRPHMAYLNRVSLSTHENT